MSPIQDGSHSVESRCGVSPVAAKVKTGAALMFPAVATTLTLYRVPGIREVNPDSGAADPMILVLMVYLELVSSRVRSYQST